MTRVFTISLPWPPAVLSPNSRKHWADRARAARLYRRDACILAQAMGCRALDAPGLAVEITFHPPDARRRDTDNMLASIKAGLDGIADATGVDDCNWHIGLARGEPVKGGKVVVTLMPAEKDNWQSIGDLAAGMVRGVVE